jgi:NitT/TauT family transport system substrate-binding protein
MKITRRDITKIALLGSAATVLDGLAAPAIAQQKKLVRIGLPTRVYWTAVPVHLAKEKPFYEKAGLNAEITIFNTGTAAVEALVAGSLDFIAQGPATIAAARSKGVKAKVVAGGSLKADGCYVMVKADSPYQKMSDLDGKKIGITGFGATTHQLALWAAESAKIKLNAVSIGGSGMIPYLMSGQVDAILGFSPLSYSLLLSKQARPLFDCGKDMPAALPDSWVASEQFIQEKPEVLDATLKALFGALRYAQSDKTFTVDWLQKYTQLDRAVCEMEFDRTLVPKPTDGNLEREWFEVSRKLAELSGTKPETLPPIDEWFTKQFVPLKEVITL